MIGELYTGYLSYFVSYLSIDQMSTLSYLLFFLMILTGKTLRSSMGGPRPGGQNKGVLTQTSNPNPNIMYLGRQERKGESGNVVGPSPNLN